MVCPPADSSADRWGLPVPAPHRRLTRIFRSDKTEQLRLGHQNPERAPDAELRGEKSRSEEAAHQDLDLLHTASSHPRPLALTSCPVSPRTT